MAKALKSTTAEGWEEVIISYQTPDLPPPYSHEIRIKATLLEDKMLGVEFSILYTNREELDEEEILEEGFTLNDDFQYEGKLPAIWTEVLCQHYDKTSWHKRNNAPEIFTIQTFKDGKLVKEGLPVEINFWEYFLQEFMQAILETSEKERPLEVVYRELKSNETVDIQLYASFQKRIATIQFKTGKENFTEKEMAWKDLKKVLKAIFLPDYLPELAAQTAPKGAGKYINPGDGNWYKFGKALLNPSKDIDSLNILEQALKDSF